MALSFLSARGNELLERAKKGCEEGKVSAALMRDIDSVLLDGYEGVNDAIDKALKEVGA